MNWYKELATYAGLGIEYDLVLGQYKVEQLKSSTFLLNPLVSNYQNIVVYRPDDQKLYDVTTDILDDGSIKVFGRKFGSVSPFVEIMDKDHLEENYIILQNTNHEIKQMLKERKPK